MKKVNPAGQPSLPLAFLPLAALLVAVAALSASCACCRPPSPGHAVPVSYDVPNDYLSGKYRRDFDKGHVPFRVGQK